MFHAAPVEGRDPSRTEPLPQALSAAAEPASSHDDARTIAELQQALVSARTIGMAIGITMRHYNVTQSAAHAFLIRTSQNSNVKLRIVAADIVANAESATHGIADTDGAVAREGCVVH